MHDAAASARVAALFTRVDAAVRAGADAAVPGIPVTDTVKRVRDDVVVETVARDDLVAVQTPQAFRRAALEAAHATDGVGTDDAALVEAAGRRRSWWSRASRAISSSRCSPTSSWRRR